MPDNHLPGCLTIVQNEAELPQYERPDDTTEYAIRNRLQSSGRGRNFHCTLCRKALMDRGVDWHASSQRKKFLSRIVVSEDQPWIEVAHHLRTK